MKLTPVSEVKYSAGLSWYFRARFNMSGTLLKKQLWAHEPNLIKLWPKLVLLLPICFRHKPLHVKKAPLSWNANILSFSIYWGLVTHICVSELGLVQVMARHLSGLRHYLNQWWPCELVLMNKLQWSVNQNTFYFIKRNMHLKMLCEMKAILCRLECVNGIKQVISF